MYNELVFLFDVVPFIGKETITFCSLIFQGGLAWRARKSLPDSDPFNISDTSTTKYLAHFASVF